MNFENAQQSIAALHAKHAIGITAADAFCAWWLVNRWNVEPQRAISHAPGGSSDYGLDGFYIEKQDGGRRVIHLIQAKHSPSLSLVKRGMEEFSKFVGPLAAILSGRDAPTGRLNSGFSKLHAALQELIEQKNRGEVSAIRLSFEVLHLCQEDPSTVANAVNPKRLRLLELCQDELADYEIDARPVSALLELLAPSEVVPAKKAFALKFGGEALSSSTTAKFFVGIGYLSDLTEMYRDLGDVIFSKNVRSYLTSSKAQDKGPAHHIRRSLRSACLTTESAATSMPERFALLHNGISIAASHAELREGTLVIREPNILNGCQTVKTAANWLADYSTKDKFRSDAWQRIRIPVRVLMTRDNELVQDVTISTNRQNAVKQSAFRANDEQQIQLAERFREQLGIFYERQEGAFQNLKKSNPRVLEEQYQSSVDKPIEMEELARCIAAAAPKPALSVAVKIADLFEDTLYREIFSQSRLAKLETLVFLRNLAAVIPSALKDIQAEDSVLRTVSMKKYSWVAYRAVARYVIQYDPTTVEASSTQIMGRFPAGHPFRTRVKVLLKHPHTRFTSLFKTHFRDSSVDETGWKGGTDSDATNALLQEAGLLDVDIFKLT